MNKAMNNQDDLELELPQGHAMAYADSQQQVDEIVAALKQAGYDESQLLILHGQDGMNLLQQEDRKFYFGDGEDSLLDHAMQELTAGNFLLGVQVEDRDEALRIVHLAEPAGARRFSYYGTWINERLTK